MFASVIFFFFLKFKKFPIENEMQDKIFAYSNFCDLKEIAKKIPKIRSSRKLTDMRYIPPTYNVIKNKRDAFPSALVYSKLSHQLQLLLENHQGFFAIIHAFRSVLQRLIWQPLQLKQSQLLGPFRQSSCFL